MAEEKRPGFMQRRHWSDTVLAVAALFVSGVSLWVGIRTENANEQLVTASTWPFEQVVVSNADPDTSLNLKFQVTNAGVGPAKIESFELFWRGRPYRGGIQLLHDCCGYKLVKATSPEAKNHMPLATGTVQGIVQRPGEVETFIGYRLGTDNLAVWSTLDKERSNMSYRICYCSVLNECYLSALRSELSAPGQLHPEKVNACPVPAVAYTN